MRTSKNKLKQTGIRTIKECYTGGIAADADMFY